MNAFKAQNRVHQKSACSVPDIRNSRKPTSDAPSLLHKYTGLYKYNNVILLSDVAYLDEVFSNLNSVQGCALAYLVSGEPQRVAVIVGKVFTNTAYEDIILASRVERHRIDIVLRVIDKSHARSRLQCLTDFLNAQRALRFEPYAFGMGTKRRHTDTGSTRANIGVHDFPVSLYIFISSLV